MTTPTPTDLILNPTRVLAREAARIREGRLIEQLTAVAFDPFRPAVRTYQVLDYPDELRFQVAGDLGLRVQLGRLYALSEWERWLEVGRELRAAWWAYEPPPDPPNIVRGTD